MRPRWLALVLVAILPACSGSRSETGQVPVEDVPAAEETMSRIGRRLSGMLGVHELSALARRADRVLPRLTPGERSDLARGGLRFRVDRPVIVDVATPARSAPFWLEDLAFERVATPIQVDGEDWVRFRKHFPAGWVGLGVNGLDRTPKAHYLAFVRSAGDASAPVLLGLDAERWHSVPARDATSAAFDATLPIGPLPDDLRDAVMLQPAHDRRHATLLARGRVWKTHVASGPGPDQVAIAFGLDPARSLAWTWRTDPGVRATVLRVAPARPEGEGPEPEAMIATIRGDSHLVESPDLLNDPSIRRHRAVASDLTPDTLYAYSLGDGSPRGWSPWKTVRTGPSRPRSFRFLYLGDPQCGFEEWGKLVSAASRRHPDLSFMLIAGDLVDRGNERTNWDHFFLRASGVFDRLPMLPCVGNHEYLDQGPRLYRAFFDLPRNGPPGIDSNLVYSFEYAGAFVAVLDSTLAIVDPAQARAQAEWLDEALGRSRATWKLVMFHHPVYASHPRRESPALRQVWGPVFDKHRVDLVLQGHDHAYLRTHSLRDGRRVPAGERGTTYVVSVSGTKFYDQRPRVETAVGFTNLSTYQTIDIEVPEDRLVYRAWDVEGREVDTLTIDGRPSSPG